MLSCERGWDMFYRPGVHCGMCEAHFTRAPPMFYQEGINITPPALIPPIPY